MVKAPDKIWKLWVQVPPSPIIVWPFYFAKLYDMKNLVKTDFDKIYEELNNLFEDSYFQPDLFPTDDYISYSDLTNYFNKYYFNTRDKDTLLPPVDDNQGWELVEHLKNIELDISVTKAFSYNAFARICLFYNTYVVEHFLLTQVVKPGHTFAPDTNNEDDDDFMYLPSHEFLRRGDGYKDSDFIYEIRGRKLTADLKFKTNAKYLKPTETWNAHGADFVYCYIVEDNKLALYKRKNFVQGSTVEAVYTQGEIKDLEPILATKLIPQILLKQPQYNHWANVFRERKKWLKMQSNDEISSKKANL